MIVPTVNNDNAFGDEIARVRLTLLKSSLSKIIIPVVIKGDVFA